MPEIVNNWSRPGGDLRFPGGESRQKCKRFGLDVGVDGNHFAPLSEEDLLFFKRAVNREYDEEVFC